MNQRRLHPTPVGEIVNDLLVDNFGEYVDLEFTARMEDGLDAVAAGSREWVPLVRDFYEPFATDVATKQKELRPADIGLATDEVCSEGHPMVIRAGKYGVYLACSNYPEHKETRPLTERRPGRVAGRGGCRPDRAAVPRMRRRARRGHGRRTSRFGPFVGCSRYPDCKYIHKTGPPPPDQLPFEVTCPLCGQGHVATRRARRTGSLFWGCSRYPKCRFTTSNEPVGALHDADEGPIARKGDGRHLPEVRRCDRASERRPCRRAARRWTARSGRARAARPWTPERRCGERRDRTCGQHERDGSPQATRRTTKSGTAAKNGNGTGRASTTRRRAAS